MQLLQYKQTNRCKCVAHNSIKPFSHGGAFSCSQTSVLLFVNIRADVNLFLVQNLQWLPPGSKQGRSRFLCLSNDLWSSPITNVCLLNYCSNTAREPAFQKSKMVTLSIVKILHKLKVYKSITTYLISKKDLFYQEHLFHQYCV